MVQMRRKIAACPINEGVIWNPADIAVVLRLPAVPVVKKAVERWVLPPLGMSSQVLT